MNSPWHDLHLRKRIHIQKEPYPHPDIWKRRLDELVLLLGVIGPLMTIPQIYEIFVNKNASGVSEITWFLFTIIDIPWIIYGLVHKERPIYITYSLWFVMNLAVGIGAVMY